MIEGIKLQLSTEKLRDLLTKRAEYHAKKAEWAATKVKEIEPELDNLDHEAEDQGKYMSNSNHGGPLQALRAQAKHHRDRVTYFEFLAENLIPNETFVLTEDDLRHIEVIGRGF